MASTNSARTSWGEDQYLTGDEILRRVRDLGPLIESESDWMARHQQMSPAVRQGLIDAGAFRIGFPNEWGGPEMRPGLQARLLEQIAYYDGGTAWNVTILADAGMLASLLPRPTAEGLYPTMDMPTSMTMHPIGRADQIAGGYRLSGTWAFGTGIRDCDLAVAGFHKYIDDEPVRNESGAREMWMAWVPRSAITTRDTWYTTGLAGSGSTGWTVEGFEIREEHLFSFAELFHGSDTRYPLVRHYPLFIANQVGVPIGLAGRALDELRSMLEQDKLSNQGAVLRQRATVQIEFARAYGLWMAARSSALSLLDEVGESLWGDRALTPELESSLTFVPVTSAQLCWQALDIVMNLVGSKSILADQPFEKCFRDMATAIRHRYFRVDHLEMAGRLLLGEPVDETLAG